MWYSLWVGAFASNWQSASLHVRSLALLPLAVDHDLFFSLAKAIKLVFSLTKIVICRCKRGGVGRNFFIWTPREQSIWQGHYQSRGLPWQLWQEACGSSNYGNIIMLVIRRFVPPHPLHCAIVWSLCKLQRTCLLSAIDNQGHSFILSMCSMRFLTCV